MPSTLLSTGLVVLCVVLSPAPAESALNLDSQSSQGLVTSESSSPAVRGAIAEPFGYDPDGAFHALLENGAYVLLTITVLAVLFLGIGLAGLAVQMRRPHPMQRRACMAPPHRTIAATGRSATDSSAVAVPASARVESLRLPGGP